MFVKQFVMSYLLQEHLKLICQKTINSMFFFFWNVDFNEIIINLKHSINYTNKKLLKKVFHCMLVHRTHNRSGISSLHCN